jgi:P4 family phage/plasmid primase-like protien
MMRWKLVDWNPPKGGSSSPPVRAPPGIDSGSLGFLKTTTIDGLILVYLEPFLRLKIHGLEEGDSVKEVLMGLRFKWYEAQYGYRYEIYGFRLRGECVEVEGQRFKTECWDLSAYLSPSRISWFSLDVVNALRELELPQADPRRVKVWVEGLIELDRELSELDARIMQLKRLTEASGPEATGSRQPNEIICIEMLRTTSKEGRPAPLPTYTFECARRLEETFNIRKWLGNLYILKDGRWVGEPDSVDILQAAMKRTFERHGLHELNWKYSTFEKEVLKILYAGAPRAEPVKGVRSGDYLIIWGDSGYEIRSYGGEFAIHDVNARVKPELLSIARAKGYKARDLALAEAPQLVEILRMWVGEPYWLTLVELVGYTTIAFRYPLSKAFMLLGQGSNGKSTFLRMLRDILGKHNVASVPLQAFTNLDYRFLWTRLVGKLVNIFADLPKVALSYTGVFKVLTGEDCLDFDRKGREPVGCYTNYAKMVFSANELPETRDLTHAFFRRWVLVEFPNVFPEDPGWYDKNITQELRDTALTIGLEAMREVLERKAFTGETYVKERWLEESDQIYKFIRVLEKLNLAKRDPKGRVEEKILYRLYIAWAELEGVEPLDKKVFTERIARYGVLKPKKHYVGLMLLERPDVVEKLKLAYEKEEGLEAYREE